MPFIIAGCFLILIGKTINLIHGVMIFSDVISRYLIGFIAYHHRCNILFRYLSSFMHSLCCLE